MIEIMDITIKIIPDDWLTKIINKEAYKITFTRNNSQPETQNHLNILNQTIEKTPIFCYSKIPVVETDIITLIEKTGFHLVDTNITLDKLVIKKTKLQGNCQLRYATPDDEKQIAEIARNNFQYSRFHLDPLFSKEIANAIKAEWTCNYFRGKRGNAMVVAIIDNHIVGFLQLIYGHQKKQIIIDLIAVNSDYRGKYIATDMIVYTEKNAGEFTDIIVGTQIANVASLRLYERLGFKIFDSRYIFHYHKLS